MNARHVTAVDRIRVQAGGAELSLRGSDIVDQLLHRNATPDVLQHVLNLCRGVVESFVSLLKNRFVGHALARGQE